MKRQEAEQRRAQLAAEHPDRQTHSFILSESDGEWSVAKVAIPPEGPEEGVRTSSSSADAFDEHYDLRLPGGIPNWTGGV